MPALGIRRLQLPGAESTETSKARTILRHAHEAAEGILESFAAVRRERGAGQGTTTDEEQDLLRAAVVFAAAGLDATLKQLIRDGLPRLVGLDDQVREGLETFVVRQLRGEPTDGEAASGRAFLARVLIAPDRLAALIEEYVLELTGSSLQSATEVLRTCAALGLNAATLDINKEALKPIFDVRNKIIHELDINLAAPNRNRQSRARATVVRQANSLLEIGEAILLATEAKLRAG